MRGKEAVVIGYRNFRGITPAYAGKSASPPQILHGFKDHPRLCGEKHLLSTIKLYHTGSPPPMRGKADHLV